MEEVKGYLQSKTVWAGVLTVVVSLGSAAGLTFGEGFIDEASALAVSITTAITGLVAIYGRVKATTKLVSKKEKAEA